MPQVVTNAQLSGITPGNDFELIRSYPLDQNVTINTARLAIKTRIQSPNTPNGPGTVTPMFLEINTSLGDNGYISDTGETSGVVVLNFMLLGDVTDLALAPATMYFFGIEVEGVETSTNVPQKYPPESGTLVTNNRFVYNS